MMKQLILTLSPSEKRSFGLHMGYSVLEGVIAGIIALNEFVFVKSLFGSGYQLSVLFQFSMTVFILLVFFNELIKRIRNKRRLLRHAALLTRLPLALVFFFPRDAAQLTGDSIYHYLFLGIFLIYYLANPIIFPSINLFLKSSYRHENFGKLYSYATTMNKIVMMITTFAYGWMLDANNYAFVYVFPVIAILGVVSVFLLSSIINPSSEVVIDAQGFRQGIVNSIKGMLDILRTNRSFLHFQIGFMLYGLGFMGSVTVIVLYFDKGLGLNYSSIAFYKNAYNVIAILSLPYFGRLIGNIDPRRFAAISFFSMMFFILSLSLTDYFPAHAEIWGITIYATLIFYILFHSVFAATMALLWSIGSAYFGPNQLAGQYQSIHLALTAVRALFAPLMGMFFYQTWGFTTAFVIAMIFLLLAGLFMLWSERTVKLP